MPLLDIENFYPWNCCPVGFLEMLGKVGLVSERYHPTHPTHPTHRARGYKWCVRLVCVQVQGMLSSHPTPPAPHPPRAWEQVMCSASNYVCKRKLRYHPAPPPTPPTPCMGTSDPIMRPSDPNFWSQVTVKCGHKWPRALWRFCWPCQRMWRFVVVSDRTLWSQVTQILFLCLWSQVTGFCGRKWPPCRLQWLWSVLNTRKMVFKVLQVTLIESDACSLFTP